METSYFDTDECRAFLKELGPPPQNVSIVNRIWYHGTTTNNYWRIKQDGGFREGTWFSRHMEDAQQMGGSVVLKVNVLFDVYESEWQVCASNSIPFSRIIAVYRVYRTHTMGNQN